MTKYLLILLCATGCGVNGTQKVDIPDSTQRVVTSGTSTFSIQFSFISEVKGLCQDSLATTEFASTAEYDKAVADCTLAKLAILSSNPKQSLCTADRTGLTPDQLVQLVALCGG